jgi:hypothetical protein
MRHQARFAKHTAVPYLPSHQIAPSAPPGRAPSPFGLRPRAADAGQPGSAHGLLRPHGTGHRTVAEVEFQFRRRPQWSRSASARFARHASRSRCRRTRRWSIATSSTPPCSFNCRPVTSPLRTPAHPDPTPRPEPRPAREREVCSIVGQSSRPLLAALGNFGGVNLAQSVAARHQIETGAEIA